MKYIGIPAGMWLFFRKSFEKQLAETLNYTLKDSRNITQKAKDQYKRIINKLPEFEKDDQFNVNIISCAMLSSFILNMNGEHSLDDMTAYYEKAMMTPIVCKFYKIQGKEKFTDKDIQQMKKTAKLRAADRNPYSWTMDYLPYKDDSGYEARFYKCGICTLMKELGIEKYTPAMCHLDYATSEAGGTDNFIRKYTLASGGPYCDCGYKKLKGV